MTSKRIAFLIVTLFPLLPLGAQDLAQKARDFLATLSPELRSKTLFTLEDAERYNMNYVPIKRKGPSFHDFGKKQKQAALVLLRGSLSEEGYRKTKEIMELEKVLATIENNRFRDPLDYHFCIFGQPLSEQPWGWRFEGHHISLNFTSIDNEIVSSTPSFFGANPAIVNIEEQKGREVLKLESKLGFMLVNSLNKDQLKVAKFSDHAPREIITGTQRKVGSIEPKGIQFTLLNPEQQETLMNLLNVYIDNYQFGFSQTLRGKIKKAGIENLYFAWAGSLKPGIGHYYSIQGPMLLIEYDNIQNNANHIHTVVRDLTNDFAEDILREHYQKEH